MNKECENCEWVRAEQTMALNEICVNKQSPYYLKIVNTDEVVGCKYCMMWGMRIDERNN